MSQKVAEFQSIADIGRLFGRWARLGLGLCLLVMVVTGLWLVGPQGFRACGRLPGWLFGVLGGMVVLAWIGSGTRMFLLAQAVGHPLRWWQALGTTVSIELGVLATPGGTGGTAIRFALLHRLGVPFSGAAAILAAEWLTDLLFFALLAPFAVYVLCRDPAWHGIMVSALPAVRVLGYLAGFGLVLGATLFLCRRLLAGHWRKCAVRGGRWRLGARLRVAGRSLRTAWRVVQRLRSERWGTLGLTLGLAAVQWFSRYGILPVVLWALGASRNPLPLILAQGCLALLALASALPGGGGTMELAGIVGLAHVVGRDEAVVAMVLWRLFTYHAYLLAGCLALPATWRSPRSSRLRTTADGCGTRPASQ